MNKFTLILRLFFYSLALIALSGCQPAVHLMPSPVLFQTGKHDPFSDTPETEQGTTIQVGYATNRLPLGAKESRFYGTNFDESIRMGVADVQIGAGDQSWEEIIELSLQGTPSKSDSILTLQKSAEMGVLENDDDLNNLTPDLRELFDRFNQAIESSATGDITIYVHGANNNFYRTASQAAQYRHFTGRQAIVVLFSWPSAESILRYGTDVRHIMRTVPTFVRFVKLLAKHTSARKINILAYSAGATLTTKSLAVLGQDTTQSDRDAYRDSLRLGSIYFAAPDTDFDDFVEEYKIYQDIVGSVTVTINEYDSVLGIAREEHLGNYEAAAIRPNAPRSGKSRLGKPDISDLTKEQADWIIEQTRKPNFIAIYVDPKTIPGMAKGSHDYWYQNSWASTDALLDLNFHALPNDRGLAYEDTEKGARIWYFPVDYETRVEKAVDKLIEKYNKHMK